LFAVAFLGSCGCSGGTTVKGTVKLDGNPVSGATVVFASEDGKTSYTGVSDDSGNFTVSGSDGKSGIPSGTYKVTVVKTAASTTGPLDPKSPEYFKAMEKDAKENVKVGKGPPGKFMGPSITMPAGGPKTKSELPEIYASTVSTPLTVKVPPDSSPVVLELSSKK
jgi:hypothetical protein